MTDMIDFINKMEEEKNAFQQKIKNAFKDILKEFFDKSGVQAITWTQYVPGFNDGDPCEFTIGSLSFIGSGFDIDNPEDPMEIENYSYYEKHEDNTYTFVKNEYTKSLEKFIYSNEGLLEDMFGVDVAIYITKDKIVTEEYDCGY